MECVLNNNNSNNTTDFSAQTDASFFNLQDYPLPGDIGEKMDSFFAFMFNSGDLTLEELKNLFTLEIMEKIIIAVTNNSPKELKDVLNSINSEKDKNVTEEQPLTQAIKVPVPRTKLPTQNNDSNDKEAINEEDIDILRLMNSGNGTIDSDFVPGNFGKFLIAYAMLNTPDVIDFLLNCVGKKYDIVTNTKKFVVQLRKENIPHLLGFLAMNNLDNHFTRFYEQIKSNSNNCDSYAENIANVIRLYFEQIFMAASTKDSPMFDKENWFKIARKTLNMENVLKSIKINDLNKLEVWKGYPLSNNTTKEAYLLLYKTELGGIVGLVIEKNINDKFYYIKSDIYFSSTQYKNIMDSENKSKEEQGYIFRKIEKIQYSFVFDKCTIFNIPSCFRNTRTTNSTNWVSLIDSKMKKTENFMAQAFKRIIDAINKSSIALKLNVALDDFLNKVDNMSNKKILQDLLIKYFVSYTSNLHNKNEKLSDIYEYYILLASYFSNKNDKIFRLIQKCIVTPPEKLYLDSLNKNDKDMYEEIFTINTYKYLNVFLNEVELLTNKLYGVRINNNQTYEYVDNFRELITKLDDQLNTLICLITNKRINDENDLMLYLKMIHSYLGVTVQFNSFLQKTVVICTDISDFALDKLFNDSNFAIVLNELSKFGLLKNADQLKVDNLTKCSFKDLDDNFKRFSALDQDDDEVATDYANILIDSIHECIESDNPEEKFERLKLELNRQEDCNYTIFDKDDLIMNSYILLKAEFTVLSNIIVALKSEESLRNYYDELYNNIAILNKIIELKNLIRLSDSQKMSNNAEEYGFA